jgi:hypothetical protein
MIWWLDVIGLSPLFCLSNLVFWLWNAGLCDQNKGCVWNTYVMFTDSHVLDCEAMCCDVYAYSSCLFSLDMDQSLSWNFWPITIRMDFISSSIS